MVFVCNLRNIHSLANVVILFAIKTCQPCHYIKPIARVYTRECHENKNTRFWATYVYMSLFTKKNQNRCLIRRENQGLKKRCHISRIFSFLFFLPFYKLLILIKAYKLHYFTFVYIQKQQIAAKSLSIQRFYPASTLHFPMLQTYFSTQMKVIIDLFYNDVSMPS